MKKETKTPVGFSKKALKKKEKREATRARKKGKG